MNHRRWRRALFMLAAGTLLSSGAYGQVAPERCVLGSGAITSGNDRVAMVGTLGQPIIGRATSSSNIGLFGFWSTLPQSGTTAVRADRGTTSAGGALRIAPNPIATTAQVRITVPAAAHVTLRIFDALGRQRQTIIDGVRQAGEIGLELDATLLESGTYSAVLSIDGSQHVLPLRVVR